jgi:hypothetical protein
MRTLAERGERLFFPKTRVSRYWGTVGGRHVWTYFSGEYNVQAWQIDFADTGIKTRGEMSDYRTLLGVSMQCNRWTAFLEGGGVFDRHFRFRTGAPNFGLNDGFLE